MKYYYAVKVGKAPGIYNTWEECKAQVLGFKGALFKKFSSKEQAINYLNSNNSAKKNENLVCNGDLEEKKNSKQNNTAIAYVDGSYNKFSKEFSCGVVIFYNGKTYEISKKYNDSNLASMRNVAGEIKASENAMRFCLKNNIKDLKIYHDYEGIAKWAKGDWKANKAGTIAYRDFFREASKKMNISFEKVKAHSGNKFNDKADQLAKAALF